MFDIKANQDRLKRLRVLQILDQVRPEQISESLVTSALKNDRDLNLDTVDIRKALDYLQQRDLATLCKGRINSDPWLAKITADGIDYLDGHGDDIAGVARPQEF